MRRKKFSFLRTVLLISVGVVFLGLSNRKIVAAEEVYKVGGLIQLTGYGAGYGEWWKGGCEMAEEEINSEGGIKGVRMKMIFEDTRSEPKGAVSAFQKLIYSDKVPAAVITGSTIVLACAPLANSTRTVLMNAAGLSPKIRSAGGYVFSNIALADFEVAKMAEYAYKNRGLRKMSILHANDDMGYGASEVFDKEFRKYGGKILLTEVHESNATDFRPFLIKVKNSNPEAVYLASHPGEAGLILKQAKQLGIKTLWLSCAPIEGATTIEMAEGAAEGVIYTSPLFSPESKDPVMANFAKRWKAKFGEEPTQYGATMYDAVRIIGEAIKNGGYSSEGIKEALSKIKDYHGVTGMTTFDRDGCAIKPVALKTVKDGKYAIFMEKF